MIRDEKNRVQGLLYPEELLTIRDYLFDRVNSAENLEMLKLALEQINRIIPPGCTRIKYIEAYLARSELLKCGGKVDIKNENN